MEFEHIAKKAKLLFTAPQTLEEHFEMNLRRAIDLKYDSIVKVTRDITPDIIMSDKEQLFQVMSTLIQFSAQNRKSHVFD
mmetsp:Transcript_22471/g.29394  ORF Transcript_22471/g.29394 Transcript_22471/m.29394 type:complete len:80 (-) Transcript_22471:69-308(-)